MLRATGEVSVGLNQGRIPPDYRWRTPGPGRSHRRNYRPEQGEESSVAPSFAACPVAPNEMETSFAGDLGMLRGGRSLAGDDPPAKDRLFASAERFITLFHSENRAGPPDRRLRHVRREIEVTGTYRHTAAELEYGARVAWRNSS